ncbi:hypothetical protein NMG60_11013595 [Bertholletia excelsa]
MKRIRLWSFMVATLHVLSWIYATSWPSAACEEVTGSILHSAQPAVNNGPPKEVKEAYYKEMSKLGSRPPNCEHKCGGCKPCKAIQVPRDNDQFRPQCANYEPEGWKCKCGTSFFNP